MYVPDPTMISLSRKRKGNQTLQHPSAIYDVGVILHELNESPRWLAEVVSQETGLRLKNSHHSPDEHTTCGLWP